MSETGNELLCLFKLRRTRFTTWSPLVTPRHLRQATFGWLCSVAATVERFITTLSNRAYLFGAFVHYSLIDSDIPALFLGYSDLGLAWIPPRRACWRPITSHSHTLQQPGAGRLSRLPLN